MSYTMSNIHNHAWFRIDLNEAEMLLVPVQATLAAHINSFSYGTWWYVWYSVAYFSGTERALFMRVFLALGGELCIVFRRLNPSAIFVSSSLLFYWQRLWLTFPPGIDKKLYLVSVVTQDNTLCNWRPWLKGRSHYRASDNPDYIKMDLIIIISFQEDILRWTLKRP